MSTSSYSITETSHESDPLDAHRSYFARATQPALLLCSELVFTWEREEFDRLRNRAVEELRHPRDTARIIIRDAVCSERTPSQSPIPPSRPANEEVNRDAA
jgi:hypothetical protein